MMEYGTPVEQDRLYALPEEALETDSGKAAKSRCFPRERSVLFRLVKRPAEKESGT